MCGISVLYQNQMLTKSNYYDFLETLKIINHRGPDDEGVVLINTETNDFKIVKTQNTNASIENLSLISDLSIENYNLILGHKRLSIIDLSILGHQPMRGKDGSWIVFNGEIYNYIEVREELKSNGCVFNTQTDTEVILEAYRIWGKDCLNKFNGMWSMCIWDAPQKKIFINNDRFGVKPLYYNENEQGFLLVSETKQIKAYHHISLAINMVNLKDFVDYGYADINVNTMFNDLYRFKKAHYIIIDVKNYKKSDILLKQLLYYRLKTTTIQITENDAIEQFRDILYDSVKLRMRADVDFGFAISGGLDSSAILYNARDIIKNENINSELLGFSAVFPGFEAADESKFVKIVSDDLPCKTIYCNPMEDFNFDAFEKHVYHQDELVSGTTYFAQWSIYQKVKESGIKILFNGQGADEVFAGYHHHFYKYCRQLLIKGNLIEYFTIVNQFAQIKQLNKKMVHQNVINEFKLKAKMKLGISKFDSVLLKYWHEIDTLDEMLVKDFDTFQLPTFLRVDDRNSMAFSVESRHPFMDYRLVEFGYSLPNNLLIKNGWQKSIIRESMTEMPNSIRYRKDKKGFTTPQQTWIAKYRNEFDSYLDYNYRVFNTKYLSNDMYRNYVIGAWLKVNKI